MASILPVMFKIFHGPKYRPTLNTKRQFRLSLWTDLNNLFVNLIDLIATTRLNWVGLKMDLLLWSHDEKPARNIIITH